MAPRSKLHSSIDSPESHTEAHATQQTPEEAIPSRWDKIQCQISTHLLPLVSQHDDLYSLLHSETDEGIKIKDELVTTCQKLFQYIEYLAVLMDSLKKKDTTDDTQEDDATHTEELLPCSLSGLNTLYTGMDESQDTSTLVEVETIWGQVDLQNNALLPRLKKLIRKLTKVTDSESVEHEIRLLNMGDFSDEEERETDENSEMEGESEEGSVDSNLYEQNENDDESKDGEMDDVARRIRERMEKAMNPVDGSDDDLNEGDDEEPISKPENMKVLAAKAREIEDSIIDPTREEMRDGFFDLHEMEAFADEEEEYLPDDAYGNEFPDEGNDDSRDMITKTQKKKVLPHIKARMGESDSDSEIGSDDDDNEDGLTKRFKPNSVRRKKYRAEDEVEALYNLYDDKQDEESDESDEEDEHRPEDMTAADFFGKPDKKLIHRYKSQHKIAENNVTEFNDADSWDDHDFAKDGEDWRGDNNDEEEVSPDINESEEEEEPFDEEDEMDEPNKLSTHAIQSKKLEQRTLLLEEEMMTEKPWKMRGESRGTDRPTDSLLDSTPEFEVAFKPPPIITAEHTASIEEVIKKRIIEEDWDDVVPRELPDIGLHKRGGGDAPEVSQEKSKLGLGELYEREYLKKTTGFDRDVHEKETEEGVAKEEMKRLFANLCSKLDALSNYHFAPRPVADEAEVTKQNVPAIAMEEVLPLHVSTSRGVAPEEVYAGGKGRQSVLKGDSEMDQTERNRLRNAKKSARRKARKQKMADEKLISKLQPGLGLNNPYEKRKLREELQMARATGKVIVANENKGMLDEGAVDKEYQTSTKFFQKMQQNVESIVRGNDDQGGNKKRRKGLDGRQASSTYKL